MPLLVVSHCHGYLVQRPTQLVGAVSQFAANLLVFLFLVSKCFAKHPFSFPLRPLILTPPLKLAHTLQEVVRQSHQQLSVADVVPLAVDFPTRATVACVESPGLQFQILRSSQATPYLTRAG